MLRTHLILLVACVGCSGAPKYDPSRPEPPGLEPRPGAYGTQTGAVLAHTGIVTSSLGAQMLRKDDTLFDSLGSQKRTIGKTLAGVGAASLTAALIDALTNNHRDRLAEEMFESGLVDRMFQPRYDVPADFERWLRDQPK